MTQGRKRLILVAAFLAGVTLVGAVLLWWHSAAEDERRRATARNFIWLLQGLDGYSTQYKRSLPSVITDVRGTPLYSWRYPVSRFVDNRFPADQFPYDVPWTDPSMEPVAKTDAYIFHVLTCDSAGRNTQILAVTGPGTAFNGHDMSSYAEYPSNLIILVSDCDHRGHWLKPGDMPADKLLESLEQAKRAGRQSEIFVGFADYQVWLLSGRVPSKNLAPFLYLHTAKEANREELLRPFLIWAYSPRSKGE